MSHPMTASAERPVCAFDGFSCSTLVAGAAKQEHHQTKGKHDQSPDQIDIHSHRSLVDNAAAREETEEAHDYAYDQEHQAHGDSQIKVHIRSLLGSLSGRSGSTRSAARSGQRQLPWDAHTTPCDV